MTDTKLSDPKAQTLLDAAQKLSKVRATRRRALLDPRAEGHEGELALFYATLLYEEAFQDYTNPFGVEKTFS